MEWLKFHIENLQIVVIEFHWFKICFHNEKSDSIYMEIWVYHAVKFH